jgi:hypothetical protein
MPSSGHTQNRQAPAAKPADRWLEDVPHAHGRWHSCPRMEQAGRARLRERIGSRRCRAMRRSTRRHRSTSGPVLTSLRHGRDLARGAPQRGVADTTSVAAKPVQGRPRCACAAPRSAPTLAARAARLHIELGVSVRAQRASAQRVTRPARVASIAGQWSRLPPHRSVAACPAPASPVTDMMHSGQMNDGHARQPPERSPRGARDGGLQCGACRSARCSSMGSRSWPRS